MGLEVDPRLQTQTYDLPMGRNPQWEQPRCRVNYEFRTPTTTPTMPTASTAVKRAIAQQAYAFSIHWDGEKLRVRSSFYDAPPHSKLACIVQVLDDKVQLRFGGGRIEWRSTTPSDPRFDGEQPETEEPRS
jgi:hypothetical protein